MSVRSLRVIVAGVVVCAVPAGGALANPDLGLHWEFDGFAGGHYFSPNNELGARDAANATSPDHSVAFGMRLGFYPVSMFGMEVEGIGMPTEASIGDAASEQFVAGYRLSAVLQFHAGRVVPFLLAGGGGASNSSERNDILLDDTDVVWHGGAGIKLAVGESWGFRLDGRVLLPPSSEDEGVAVDGEGLLGLYTTFGGGETAPAEPDDGDGDGVLGDADRCPDKAEDKDNFEDADGCPDGDNDGDRIADADDKCPAEAETMNQIDDTDGCPEKDEDQDGLLGTSDECPTEAEDKDNHEDDNGCPDPDNDGDGVADAGDKCPAESESANGFQDTDGCPDDLPAEVKKFTGVIKGIRFALNSAKLSGGSSRTLTGAVKVLQQYPDLRVEISGHTDNTGDAERNRTLSQERADSVKAFLVSKGIAAERLEAKGYGPDKPLADNATKAGQAKNRRVEFTPISTVGGGGEAGAPAPGTQPTKPGETPAKAGEPGEAQPKPGESKPAKPGETTPAKPGESGESQPKPGETPKPGE
jgi:outer membrane protein OmpA-like peptidoglycan-associated protein